MALPRQLQKIFNACAPRALQRAVILSPLREGMAKSPAATAAFDWLAQENIRIVFDKKLAERKMMGRYNRHRDDRWIALSPKFRQGEVYERIDTLVHETRHAWQDKNDLMLPYHLKFNMKHGMLQAFLWLCVEEADAHAHGMMAAAEAFGATMPQALGYQSAYIDWFTGRLGVYLDSFIEEWKGLIGDIEARTGGDAAKMRTYLDDCREADQSPVDQTTLRALGQTLTGINYQHDADFSVWVRDVLIPKALAGPIAEKTAELAQLDARMAAFTTLAANQNAPVKKSTGNRRRA